MARPDSLSLALQAFRPLPIGRSLPISAAVAANTDLHADHVLHGGIRVLRAGLADVIGIDVENTCFNDVLAGEVRQAGGLYLIEEFRRHLEDAELDQTLETAVVKAHLVDLTDVIRVYLED